MNLGALLNALVVSSLFYGIVVIAGYPAYRNRDRLLKLDGRQIWVLLSPFVFPVFITAWGVLFWWHGAEDTEPAWHVRAFRYVCFLYPILCIYSVWQSHGSRWLAVSLIPLSFVISLFATAWAAAALTGD